jgi:hypothetical protein
LSSPTRRPSNAKATDPDVVGDAGLSRIAGETGMSLEVAAFVVAALMRATGAPFEDVVRDVIAACGHSVQSEGRSAA